MSDISDFNLDSIQTGECTGMDAFFAKEPQIVSPVGTTKAAPAQPRIKVGRTSQLNGFVRISEDMLVNKATQDLWAIKKHGDNDYYIERLFADDGSPLKG